MIGLVSYLATLSFLSPAVIVLSILFFIYRCGRDQKDVLTVLKFNEVTLALFVFYAAATISVFIYIFGGQSIYGESKSIVGDFPFVFLLLGSFCVALSVRQIDLHIILAFFCLEAVIGVAEYVVGVRSFLNVSAAHQGGTEMGETSLLYYNRVFGLSSNSSAFAFKALVAVGIIYVLRDYFIKRVVLLCIVLALILSTLLVTFNRTVLVSLLAFLLVTLSIRAVTLGLTAVALTLPFSGPVIYEQFFRGREVGDVSGREWIYSYFMSFIEDNVFFGNNGAKLFLPVGGNIYHAHNSFLQLLASSGLIIGLLIIFATIILCSKKGLWPLLVLYFVYSLAQYGLYWGLSFNDVIFFSLILYVYKNGTLLNKRCW